MKFIFRSDRFYEGLSWSISSYRSRSWSLSLGLSNETHLTHNPRPHRTHSEWMGYQISFGWTRGFSGSISWDGEQADEDDG